MPPKRAIRAENLGNAGVSGVQPFDMQYTDAGRLVGLYRNTSDFRQVPLYTMLNEQKNRTSLRRTGGYINLPISTGLLRDAIIVDATLSEPNPGSLESYIQYSPSGIPLSQILTVGAIAVGLTALTAGVAGIIIIGAGGALVGSTSLAAIIGGGVTWSTFIGTTAAYSATWGAVIFSYGLTTVGSGIACWRFCNRLYRSRELLYWLA